MRSKALSATIAVVAAAAAILASSAAAEPPAVTITQVDHTFTLPAGPDTCPFTISGHTMGTFRETVFSSGRDVTDAVDFHITYSNPSNGKTATTALAGPFIIEPNQDGTVTVTIDGNDGHVTAPGHGSIFADVGKLVYVADPSDVFTPLNIIKSTGQQDPNQFPATCDALS